MLADFDVGFLFDFANNGRIGALAIDGRAFPVPSTALKVGFELNPDGFVVDELLTEGSWVGEKLGATLRYRYLNRIPQFFENFQQDPDRFDDFKDINHVNQADLSLRYQFTRSWSVRHRIAYSFEGSFVLAHSAAVEYLSKCDCWAAGIEVRQNRQLGFEFALLYRVVGLGNDSPAGAMGLGDIGFAEGF